VDERAARVACGEKWSDACGGDSKRVEDAVVVDGDRLADLKDLHR